MSLPSAKAAFTAVYVYFHCWRSGAMEEEEQFENIDLNDDDVCSVCKLETEAGTLSFCHLCFELSMEGEDGLFFRFPSEGVGRRSRGAARVD